MIKNIHLPKLQEFKNSYQSSLIYFLGFNSIKKINVYSFTDIYHSKTIIKIDT